MTWIFVWKFWQENFDVHNLMCPQLNNRTIRLMMSSFFWLLNGHQAILIMQWPSEATVYCMCHKILLRYETLWNHNTNSNNSSLGRILLDSILKRRIGRTKNKGIVQTGQVNLLPSSWSYMINLIILILRVLKDHGKKICPIKG